MANFRYSAKNMEGKTLRGTMEASGLPNLQQQLKAQGLFLMEAKEREAKKHKKIGSRQLSEFCKELSALLSSGVSIVRALEIVAEEEGTPKAVRNIYQELETRRQPVGIYGRKRMLSRIDGRNGPFRRRKRKYGYGNGAAFPSL